MKRIKKKEKLTILELYRTLYVYRFRLNTPNVLRALQRATVVVQKWHDSCFLSRNCVNSTIYFLKMIFDPHSFSYHVPNAAPYVLSIAKFLFFSSFASLLRCPRRLFWLGRKLTLSSLLCAAESRLLRYGAAFATYFRAAVFAASLITDSAWQLLRDCLQNGFGSAVIRNCIFIF